MRGYLRRAACLDRCAGSGLGKLGLPMAARLSGAGHRVLGFDPGINRMHAPQQWQVVE